MLTQLATGTSVGQIQGSYAAEAGVPEGSRLQCTLSLAGRTGIESLASAINWAVQNYGLSPWSAGIPYAQADPNKPLLYIRWTKGHIGLPLVAAVLAGGTAAVAALGALGIIDIPAGVVALLAVIVAVLLVGWALYRLVVQPVKAVLEPIVNALAPVKPYLLPAGVGLALLYGVSEAADLTPRAISIRAHLQQRPKPFSVSSHNAPMLGP